MQGWTYVRTSDAGAVHPTAIYSDTGFLRAFVVINGAVPLLILAWDAWRHQLGVNSVNFALHTTGLLGLLFLLLSLTVTPLRRLTGWNSVIAVRRWLGLHAFFYLGLHLGIFYIFDRAGSLSSTVHEIVTRRYLQLGTLGFALLVPLAVTSTDAMISRLGPRRWKALHRLTYGATILGAVHYYLLVKADVRQPAAFAAALGVLLGYRLLQFPLDARRARSRAAKVTPRRFWSGELRVLRITQETHDVKTFRFGALAGGPLPFVHKPGQYLNLSLIIDGEQVNRSYSIVSPPTQDQYCEVTVKRTANGRASRYLHDVLREGAVVRVSAPAGRFVFTGSEADSVVLIAGGVGITPLMAILRNLRDQAWKGDAYLIFAVTTARDIIFFDELKALASRFLGFHLTVTLSGEDDPSWRGARGRVSTELLTSTVPGLLGHPIYLCGPDPMMAEVRRILGSLGVDKAQIKTELFISTPAAKTGGGGAVEASTAVAAPSEAATMEDGIVTIEFRRSGKVAELPVDTSILEAAEDAGVDLPFECRSGICGQCKTKLISGRVTMDVQDALTPSDRMKGLILACQAHSRGSVVVDV
jgi:ferredoxin-NADP reductase/DMSO/TMAO reductase YedYZ heme-binding membrane subunit